MLEDNSAQDGGRGEWSAGHVPSASSSSLLSTVQSVGGKRRRQPPPRPGLAPLGATQSERRPGGRKLVNTRLSVGNILFFNLLFSSYVSPVTNMISFSLHQGQFILNDLLSKLLTGSLHLLRDWEKKFQGHILRSILIFFLKKAISYWQLEVRRVLYTGFQVNFWRKHFYLQSQIIIIHYNRRDSIRYYFI